MAQQQSKMPGSGNKLGLGNSSNTKGSIAIYIIDSQVAYSTGAKLNMKDDMRRPFYDLIRLKRGLERSRAVSDNA